MKLLIYQEKKLKDKLDSMNNLKQLNIKYIEN